MRKLYWITLTLTIIGALNWGLFGLFQFDLVASLLDGQTGPISRFVYSLVGIAGVILLGTVVSREGREAPRDTLRRAS